MTSVLVGGVLLEPTQRSDVRNPVVVLNHIGGLQPVVGANTPGTSNNDKQISINRS